MLTQTLVGLGLCLLPVLLALPWLWALEPAAIGALVRRPVTWVGALGIVGVLRLALGLFIVSQAGERVELWGRLYGAVLYLMLAADLFIMGFWALLRFWPRGSAVALAAFREGVRQPLFWTFVLGTACGLVISMVIPYFTFGDDYKMMKHLGFDMIMLMTGLFVISTASMSISEEIEGRTAVTLMSKPLSRRQFLLGKFVGILLVGLAMTCLLGWCLNWALYIKPYFDPLDDVTDALQVQIQPTLSAAVQTLTPDGELAGFLEGVSQWLGLTLSLLPGLGIGFCQVMVLLGIAAALATRLPLAVNLMTCLVLFFLGNLAPYLLLFTRHLQGQYAANHQGATNPAIDLVHFVARLCDTVVPALEYFGLGPAIVRDAPLPIGPYLLYAASVAGYSLLYTAIALLLGLILFEDRDLA